MDATSKGRLWTAGCCAALLCGAALAQQDAGAKADAKAPPAVGDQVIVVGKSPGQLRLEMQRAEEAVYDRFNQITSNPEFQIHCRREAPLGSHIGRRVCQTDFWREEEAKAGQEQLRALQGSIAGNPDAFFAEGQYKTGLMREEMRRLAKEDKPFQKALVRFVTLKAAFEGAARNPPKTAAVETTDQQGALPYDAALAADVRIGRRPWSHALTQRTFTFAHVFGTIDRLEVDCAAGTEPLQYAEGAEWTLPKDWRSCELHVDAPRGTTFTLYEFRE
jgi:hypothetical protein